MQKLFTLFALLATTLCMCLISLEAGAQAPQKFSYQAIIRDGAGLPLLNTPRTVELQMRQGSAAGVVVYSEYHNATTNGFGLVNLNVGDGILITGAFTNIDWGAFSWFMNVNVQGIDMGTTQLLSVPYALYAEESGTPGSQGPAGTTGPAGPQGPTGTTGATGPAGSQGPAGNTGATGAAGQPGATGAQGPIGNTGPAGAAGADGAANAWALNGTAASATNFIGTTNNQPLKLRVNGQAAGSIAPAGTTYNVSYGDLAQASLTSGTKNTAVGSNALAANQSGNRNVAVGHLALGINVQGDDNAAVGDIALANSTASFNSAFGSVSLYANTTGEHNTGLGYAALRSNAGGGHNTAVGSYALQYNQSGFNNTALGYGALFLNTGSYNNAIGAGAMDANAGGLYNNAFGVDALGANTTGGNNTAMGHNAMATNIGGEGNTAIGANAGPLGTFFNNTTALGNGALPEASNHVRVGNTSVQIIGGYAAWSNFSDIRFKTNIAPQTHGLDFILKLEPITYHMDVRKLNSFLYGAGDTLFTSDVSQQAIHDKEAILYSGFSAQQVEQAASEVGYDFSGVYKPQNEHDHYALAYAEFVVPLVKAVQELNARNETLAEENAELRSHLQAYGLDLEGLKAAVAKLNAAADASERVAR